MFFLQAGKGVEGFKIAAEARPDTGPDDLDGDGRAIAPAHRLVYLGDGRSRHRLGEIGKHPVKRPTERSLDLAHRLGTGKGLHAILQQFKIAGNLRTHHVGPGREELAELDP